MEIAIQPKVINTTFTFDTCKIVSMVVNPFNNAKLYVDLHFVDATNTIRPQLCVVRRELEMTNEEYNLWTDDEYLVSYVKAKLNLS